MMAERRFPFGDLSNAAGPSTLPSNTPPHFFKSPVKALSMLTSPQKDTATAAHSYDSEQGILTECESDWFSDDTGDDDVDGIDDSMATVSPSTRKLHRPAAADQQSSSPPPIFFGTPSQTEHDCRLKYQAQVRTRRLLRKDSIELTRRKSGGWETHTRDERTEVKMTGEEAADEHRDAEVEEAAAECRASMEQAHLLTPSSSSPFQSTDALTLDAAEDDVAQDNQSPRQDEDHQKSDDCRSVDEEKVPTNDEITHESIDPDETEEADWFGQKALNQSNRSSSPTPSLPSTPTRRETGRGMQLARRTASLAPSDADSSPGVALALHSFVNRPSPLNFAMSSHNASPYAASPTLARSAPMSPEFDQENMVHEWRQSAARGEPSGAGESPFKASGKATPVLSPTKVNVRQNLAAWAHARVKTPQSPEKKEWEQLRASMALSPTLGKEAALQESERLLMLATQVKLPASVQKTPLQATKQKHNSTLSEQVSRQSPDRLLGSALRQQSKLPIPAATSRLPRPFKLSVAKTPTPRMDERRLQKDARANNNDANAKAHAIPAKPTTASAYRKSVVASREFAPPPLHSSSSNSSSLHSSSPRHAFARTRPTAFSSPAKSAKPCAPIVRDARLIASRNGLSSSQSQTSAPTQPDLIDNDLMDKAEEGTTNVFVGSKSEQVHMDATLPPQASRSGSVGGARRLVLGGAGAHDRSEASRVAAVRPTLESPAPLASAARRLGVREVRTELAAERSRRNQARPMRRINDLVRKVDHSAATSSLETSRPSSAEARALPRGDRGTTLQRATHTERREPSVAKVAPHTDRLAAAAASQMHIAANEPPSLVAPRAPASSTLPQPLPLSSADLSKLTSYHTRCNETCVVQLQFVLIRKQGQVRPPSPSSKFRKASATAAAANTAAAVKGALSTKQKAERAAKEAHDRRTRALQRAEGGGGGEVASTNAEDDDDARNDGTRHRLGAGDEAVYQSPVRRISLKKVVRWHRALFLGPHDRQSRAPSTSKSCLASSAANLVSALDRFGNVQQAGKPVGSPTARRRKVLVTKIVYDDDDEA